MLTIRRCGMAMIAAAMMSTLACKDDSTGPGISFPDLPQLVRDGFCVRGNGQVGETKSGTISSTDCDVNDFIEGEVGYHEVWRVRVAASRDVTFDANSPFDNLLTVLRINSYTQTGFNYTILGENDGRTPTNTNALLTVFLEPNIDYFVIVSGLDYQETGDYTVAIQ